MKNLKLKIFAVLLLVVGSLIYYFFNLVESLVVNFSILMLAYTFIYLGIYAFFYHSIRRRKKINFLFEKVLSFPMVSMLYIFNIISPLFVVFLFLFLYFVPSLVILKVTEDQFVLGLLYLTNVLTIAVYTYSGDKIMKILITLFEVNFLKVKLITFSDKLYMRKAAYFFIIIIYLAYNFLIFSKISVEILSVTQEVLITFIAIDTFIQLYKKNYTIE